MCEDFGARCDARGAGGAGRSALRGLRAKSLCWRLEVRDCGRAAPTRSASGSQVAATAVRASLITTGTEIRMYTPFEELDCVLAGFTSAVRGILGETFVGAYLQGSFALGAGDMQSDCDFIVATTVLPSGPAEASLRRLHDEIPVRAGFWTRHLEGSYADVTSLRGVGGLGTRWLFCDHGYCRVLYTGKVASKRGALDWARSNLDPAWGPLLTQVAEDRALGWDPADPPRPGSLEAMQEFAAYAESFARR